MAFHPQRQALDQRRPAAVARLLDRALRLAVDGEHVGAVDDDAVEAVRLRAVGDVLGRVLEVRRRRVRPLVVVADEDDRAGGAMPANVIASCVSPRADAPSPNQPTATRFSSRIRNASAQPTATGSIAGRWLTIAISPRRESAMWTLPSLPFVGPSRAAHVLGEDPPRLDAARDVHAHVAVERRADVVGAHRRRDADGGGLVAAARVERAGDLALPVEDVPALLDPARDQHVAVDAEQVLAVEAGLLDLLQRADRLGSRRDRHVNSVPLPVGTLQRPIPTGTLRGVGKASDWLREERRKVLGDWVAFCRAAASRIRWFEEFEAEVPARCPQCDGELLRRCPACDAPFSVAFASTCEECGENLRENLLFGAAIRRER